MKNQDNVVSFENIARERDASLSSKLVREMRQIVMNTLPKLVQSLYDKLDDGLFEQALFEKSGKNDALDNLFFETMRQLRRQREGFIRSYVRKLVRNYDEFWQMDTPREEQTSVLQDISEESLTLIDESEFEEDLALDGVIAKGMRQFSKEIYALNQRFAAIKGIDDVSDEDNPIAPPMVSRIFPASIGALDVDLRIKLVIYKLFEREVVQYLGAMYDEVNELLKNAGVLPKLPSRVKRNPVSPAVIRHREMTASADVDETESLGADQQAALDDSDQAELFNALRGLLQTKRVARPENHASLPKVEVNDLLSALSGMQTGSQSAELTLDRAVNDIGELRQNLSSSLQMGNNGGAVKAFSGMDEDTIDVISMLFEFILEDPNLPDAMKALLSRLQIPMLKVAILDRQFFADKQHSARKLLNLLAKSAVGWVDDGDRSDASLYGKISSIVMRILEEFREDLGMFDELYEEFYQFINQEEQGAGVIEERITEVTKGKEKMKLAQMRVAEVINTRVKGAVLPEVVKDLLKDGWKDVLTLAYLRQGEDSEKWIHVVGLVDKLLWSVQPKVEIADRQKLLKSIPELLKALRAELVEISFDQHKLGKIFKALQTCHIHALKGADQQPAKANEPKPTEPVASGEDRIDAETSVGVNAAEPAEAETADVDKGLARETIQEDIIETPMSGLQAANAVDKDEYLEQAESLEVGTWVEWLASDGNELRGKLTWKSTVTGTLIFVGRKGTKLAELNQVDLADLLRMKKAKLLQGTDQPLLERAMNAMMETLKKTDPANA